jgi:hypothetical protein
MDCSWALMVHSCNPSNLGGRDQKDHSSRPSQALHETLSQKYPIQKRACGGALVVEHLPNDHEALSSNCNTIKKK